MIKKQFFMGFAGFLGFFSIKYFFSGDVAYLAFIGFFAFFANFIIARISGDKADERYIENKKAAMAFTGQFAIIELFVLWCVTMLLKDGDLAYVLLALAYAVTLNVYAIKLYLLEER